jgi:putative sporulation protein YyaC
MLQMFQNGVRGGVGLAHEASAPALTSNLLADLHYTDAGAAQMLAAALREEYRAEQKGDKYLPFFFMVGATSSTGDALGPFIGWFLKRKGFTGEFLGDLENPVHATNIREKLNEAWLKAMRRNKFPYIIAVDAAVGRPGRVTVNRGPLRPGAGMGKTLPQVGSLHIMGGTAHFPFMIWFTGLDQTVAMAEMIADGLFLFWEDCEAGRI